jgi:hypothetical protein
MGRRKDATVSYPQFYSAMSWRFSRYYTFLNNNDMISSDISFCVAIRHLARRFTRFERRRQMLAHGPG